MRKTVLKRVILAIAIASVIGFVALRAPRVALVLLGAAVAALLVRSAWRTRPMVPPAHVEPPPAPEPEPDVLPAADRATAAVNVARRELGQPEVPFPGDIEAMTSSGRCVIRIGYQADIPFVAIRHALGDETEMAFVVRRHHSLLGLPRLVDNTPIETTSIEYRLRSMPLESELGGAFDAATNRPRLFRELMLHGLEADLDDALYHPMFRLEDLVYGGDSLTVVVHPAADPADGPFLNDCLAFARPFDRRVRSFLDEHPVRGAQG